MYQVFEAVFRTVFRNGGNSMCTLPFDKGSAAGIQSFILGGAELEAARTANESILSA